MAGGLAETVEAFAESLPECGSCLVLVEALAIMAHEIDGGRTSAALIREFRSTMTTVADCEHRGEDSVTRIRGERAKRRLGVILGGLATGSA